MSYGLIKKYRYLPNKKSELSIFSADGRQLARGIFNLEDNTYIADKAFKMESEFGASPLFTTLGEDIEGGELEEVEVYPPGGGGNPPVIIVPVPPIVPPSNPPSPSTLENSFTPINLINGSDGKKPMAEFSSACAGANQIWQEAVTNNKEIVGLLTMDNKFIKVAVLGATGGQWGGLYKWQGQAFYTWPKTYGSPTQTYTGMITTPTRYFIPVRATVHTHNACANSGGDGVSNLVQSPGDAGLASKFNMINHYVVGCNALGTFNSSQNDYTLASPGDISATCTQIQ